MTTKTSNIILITNISQINAFISINCPWFLSFKEEMDNLDFFAFLQQII